MKKNYNQPQMAVEAISAEAFVMIPPSPDPGYSPAPRRDPIE